MKERERERKKENVIKKSVCEIERKRMKERSNVKCATKLFETFRIIITKPHFIS